MSCIEIRYAGPTVSDEEIAATRRHIKECRMVPGFDAVRWMAEDAVGGVLTACSHTGEWAFYKKDAKDSKSICVNKAVALWARRLEDVGPPEFVNMMETLLMVKISEGDVK